MSKENEVTLEVYDKLAKIYLDNTTKHDAANPEKAAQKRAWLQKFLESGFGSSKDVGSILEIGAGDGNNSVMLRDLGFKVIASDVAPAFLAAIGENGFKPIRFNVLEDHLERKFDGVFAWRVFVHFTKEDARIAIENIYSILAPGGRFVFNVQNADTAEKIHVGWSDDPGDHHMGEKRFFQPYSEAEIDQILREAGFAVLEVTKNGGERGDRWLCIIAEKPAGVSSAVIDYVENGVIPQYARLSGHSEKHIRQVMRRSLMFAEGQTDINYDMVYMVAAYHDLGRLVDDEMHHIESAKMMRADKKLRDLFSETEIGVMAEAVEDHRASLKHDPRSIYGKIVSSADRNTDLDDALERVYDIIKLWHPEWGEDEIIEDGRVHLREKYTPGGYAAKKMYFKDPDFEEYLQRVEEITRDPAEYCKIMKAFNRKRGVYN